MKPILVNNQQELDRLAPVLEKQGKKWQNGEKPNEFTPNKLPFLLFFNGVGLYFAAEMSDYKETQSVDEYLQANEPTKVDEPDYKALYEALQMNVRDSISEMCDCKMAAWKANDGSERAYINAMNILTTKTGIEL